MAGTSTCHLSVWPTLWPSTKGLHPMIKVSWGKALLPLQSSRGSQAASLPSHSLLRVLTAVLCKEGTSIPTLNRGMATFQERGETLLWLVFGK